MATASDHVRRRALVKRRKSLGFSQEKLAEQLKVERSTVVRWEAGRSEPQAWMWPKLAAALQVTPEQLTDLLGERSTGAAPGRCADDVEEDVDRRAALKAIGIGAASITGVLDVRDLVLDSARTSALLRAGVETPGISRTAMATARERLYSLATSYAFKSDLTTLRELVELRDGLHRVTTTRQHHPGDTRDLYVLLGATCILLSSLSHDLSEPDAGMTHAATAETFAKLAGHSGLLTWIHCTKAMIASWWSSPADVLHYAHTANSVGAVGISAIRLAGLQARALAQLGMREDALSVLNAAHDKREELDERDDLQELGEVFTFPLARQHYYTAATHLHLGNWTQVEKEATEVERLYESSANGQTWPVTLTLSRVYRAHAVLHNDGPDGAASALRQVFDLPPTQRIPQISRSLAGLRESLSADPYVGLPAANELSDSIRSFQRSGRRS